ncbi:AcrR family transcriptional regulator [Microlunatus panaciterrae]|uniref:AcrR family transcriptional regulator n=1 Tax=Microlunatus panaciterrae TaxID=400768 RepID=A0ABS2RLU5_9ACTN|nr:TetR/AcrR family transcriptional regulator [Microlunatus panaciterrae]MBM7799979.1 AcrR family transcriptional regulator [Microlunatus panaciterrae]
MSESGIGLREMKKQMTRESIADAALQLALEKGLDHVTIEEIAHVAFVSPRTFSNYFTCKEEAVVAAGTQDTPGIIEDFLAVDPAEPTLKALATILIERAKVVSPEQLTLSLQKMALAEQHPSLRPFQTAQYEDFEAALREAVATRSGTDVDSDMYPWLVTAAAIAGVKSATRMWALSGADPKLLPELLQVAFDQIREGLPAPRRPKAQPAASDAESTPTENHHVEFSDAG